MMNYHHHHHHRPVFTPVGSRKRKEPEPFYAPKPSSASYMAKPGSRASSEPVCSNQLLAGYMAYEFLTKGTLMGQEFDPGRAEPKLNKPVEFRQTYDGLASVLKTSEAHVPGIVNPSQLARWIKM